MTKLYAVIGSPILHSKSPQIMNAAFANHGLESHYTRIASDEIEDALFLVKELDIKGINCTAPYKALLTQYADTESSSVKNLGFANTLINSNNSWEAFNTDIAGVWESLKNHISKFKDPTILIIGAGGAASSAAMALQTHHLTFTICNRTLDKAQKLAKKFSGNVIEYGELYAQLDQFNIIISTIDSSVLEPSKIKLNKEAIVFDAIYKSSIWKDLLDHPDMKLVQGKEWLIHQGMEAFTHFTNKKPIYEHWLKAFEKTHLKKPKIALIGFMGSGKTAVAKQWASLKKWSVIDTDNWIEEKSKTSIKLIFEEEGEKAFRKMETEALKAAIASEHKIISCGGGIITLKEHRDLLQENCICVWLYIDASTCLKRTRGEHRPLLNKEDPSAFIKNLMNERSALYAVSSDLIINTIDKSIEEVAKKLDEEINQAGYS